MLKGGIDTLIVWTESNGTDMALSFQEAEGCAAIWLVQDVGRREVGSRRKHQRRCLFGWLTTRIIGILSAKYNNIYWLLEVQVHLRIFFFAESPCLPNRR